MNRLKNIIAESITKELNGLLDKEEIFTLIEIPKQEGQGDFAFPCFRLSKELRKSPNQIAEELSLKIKSDFFKLKDINGYLNFYIDLEYAANTILPEILKEKDRYGKSDIGKNKRVIVEYSSANISKELHFGYIRGIMIGLSLYKISKELGYDTVTINHLGDYGINFGKIITAYLRWGNKEDVEKRGVKALLDLYVRFNNEEKEDPSLMKEAVNWFYKLEEEKDKKAYELWAWFKEISLNDYNKVYNLLECHFDSYAGESFYSDKMEAVKNELRDKNLVFYDDKTELIDLSDDNLTNVIITTSAGTSLYITRDIAAALYRKNHYDFYKCFYVVGSEQKLHFNQLKAIIKKMGYDWWKDIIHVDHGLIMLEGKKISSRSGDSLFLEDVLEEAYRRTINLMDEKNPNLENKEKIAKEVAFGAIAFKELSTSRSKDYDFRWDDAINFEGETGPYLQYTNVRCKSLLRQSNTTLKNIDYKLLRGEYTKSVVLELSKYRNILKDSFDKQDPSVIARYLISLAKKFNKYYQNINIIVDDKNKTASNLALVQSVSHVLQNGMKLINMKSPDKM